LLHFNEGFYVAIGHILKTRPDF
jgi:hypothetical protein